MKTDKIKKAGLAVLVVFLGIVLFWIVHKLVQSSAKVQEKSVSVSSIKAGYKDIDETVVINGVAEGDPQVKVYPAVPGTFERAAVKEGSFIKKDEVILYIDRNIVGAKFELAPVKSPIDGIVTNIYTLDKGTSVSPLNAVAEITNPNNIKVVLNIGEEDLIKVKTGMAAQINSVFGATSLKAYVYSRTPYIDTETMAGTIIVKAKNTGNDIKPGDSVLVTIFTKKKMAILLPQDAVLMGQGKEYVYVNVNGRAKSVKVETGYMTDNEVEIKSGVSEGDEVITDGNFKLTDGVKISVQ